MVDVTSPTPDEQARKRPQPRPAATNVLKPSRGIVSWIDRAVQRVTDEPPWHYQDDPSRESTRPSSNTLASDGDQSRQAQRSGRESPLRRTPSLDTQTVPEDIGERFVRMGRAYYFPSGDIAFRDRGKKVITQSENLEVVHSLVQIAQARGWEDVTVSGSERFRREAWRIGTLAGLVVRGYQPTVIDKRQFVRDIAQARSPPRPSQPLIDPLSASTQFSAIDSRLRKERSLEQFPRAPASSDLTGGAGQAPKSPDDDLEGAGKRARPKVGRNGPRVYAGKLVAHGEAPYKFQDGGEASYFIRLETDRGLRELWGLDLQRAIADASLKEGDLLQAQVTGRKSVTIKRPERDQDGRVIGEVEVPAHRNQWAVRRDGDRDATADQSSDRSQGVRTPSAKPMSAGDPAVDSALLAVRAAQLFAEQRISDPSRRGAFVDAVREHLSAALDRDDPIRSPLRRQRAPEQAHYNGCSLG